ncbi:MAG: peptide chain release factor N(5)-glutamine methyltransferase [Butyrivibrio sp.]|nr:peptide chain release factor N(5)-glutamine methyltransferase [Butyrivibrio sp.]
MNYKDAYINGTEELTRAWICEAKLDARLLLEYVCGTDHSALLTHPERELTDTEAESYESAIKRRSAREPVAYILGTWDFMGLSFKVTGDVLIPEQDSEFLVEEALRHCEDGMKVMDLCTGSGCIGLSILKFTNETKALCTDISEAALSVAKENADKLGLSDRVNFLKTDLFPEDCNEKFDLIVSNPPYIRSDVIGTLEPEVKDFEPRLALDGSEDGLVFYRRIADKAPSYLYSSGYLIMEIGYDQAEAVTGILEEKGCYHGIEVIKDFSGNDRVIKACFY